MKLFILIFSLVLPGAATADAIDDLMVEHEAQIRSIIDAEIDDLMVEHERQLRAIVEAEKDSVSIDLSEAERILIENTTEAIRQSLLDPVFGSESIPENSSSLQVRPTFNSVGIALNGHDQGQDHCDDVADDGYVVCDQVTVEYREDTSATWLPAVDMVYDPFDFEGVDVDTGQYRGSVVGLDADTTYQLRVTVNGTTEHFYTFRTWPETTSWTISQTSAPTGQTTITTSGSGSEVGEGYHLVDMTGVTVTGGDGCVTIDASHVILRGVRCTGQTGPSPVIEIVSGNDDILIEDVEIDNWGCGVAVENCTTEASSAEGHAIYLHEGTAATETARVVIQRAHIHSPAWGPTEPGDLEGSKGPTGIMTQRIEQGHSHVYRHNTFEGSESRWMSDGMRGTQNTSPDASGLPHDSDIHGNYLRYMADDCIEAEGQISNVRIYKNFCSQYGIAFAQGAVTKGPLYLYRNVVGDCRGRHINECGHVKVSNSTTGGTNWHGRAFIFHNTFLNISGANHPGGGTPEATQGNHWAGPPRSQTGKNNIWVVSNGRTALDSGSCFEDTQGGDQYNSYDHEMYWPSEGLSSCHTLTNGINDEPAFDGNYVEEPAVGADAFFRLQVDTSGHDDGVIIPNFSAGFTGLAPDIGAMEHDQAAMCFGHAC